MIRVTALFCLLTVYTIATAQSVKVPSRMEFAGIKLRIMDDAREEIQEDVNALTASPKYYEIKAERARTYFPIIERIFREEGLPDDFKYLCLQESALISDAVSSSNAVGFWQFKDFSAMEVGMRVDKHVDERMNIVSSSRGAARYLQNNNQHFDNWLHALQAYQMGAGGAMKVLKSGDEGAKSMTINKKTYWYVKKYLAHKIAFEGAVSQKGMLEVSEYYDGGDKTLKQIANETNVSEEELTKFNKWLKKGKVPTDKKYAVIIPKPGFNTPVAVKEEIAAVKKPQNKVEYTFDAPGTFPKIEDEIDARAGKIVDINGLPGIVAGRGVRIPELAVKADISLSKILKYNDLGIDGQLIPGQVYYLKNKRNKARAYYHVVEPGENLWSISQKFGIKLKKLKVKNRIKEDVELKPGRVLWLRYIRPSNVEIEYKEVPIPVKPLIVEPIEVKPTIKPQTEIIDTTIVEIDTIEVVATDTLDNEILADSSEVIDEINEKLPEQISENEGLPLLDTTYTDSFNVTHEVKLGETYYAISKIYNVSVLDILEWNSLNIGDKLSVGQKLIIITKDKPSIHVENKTEMAKDSTIYHLVKEGETLYQIARQYGVSVQNIMSWNNKDNFSISYGEKLKIVKPKEEN